MSNQIKPEEDHTGKKDDTEKKVEECQSETGDDMDSEPDKSSESEDSGSGRPDSDCDRFKLLPLPPKRKQLKKKRFLKRRRESTNSDSSPTALPMLRKNWNRTIDELTRCSSAKRFNSGQIFSSNASEINITNEERLASLSLNDTIADQLVPMETQMAEQAEPKVPPNTPVSSQNLNMMEVDKSP